MEFVIKNADLKQKLEIARRFTGKTTMEITEGIRLYVPKNFDVLVLEACNLIKGCRIKIEEAHIIQKGSVVVDGTRLQKFISSFPLDESFSFKLHSQLEVSTNSGTKFKLSRLNPLEFPEIPNIDPKNEKFVVEAENLSKICNRIKFATDPSLAKDTSRLFAEILYFRKETAFATDAHKLAALKLPESKIDNLDLPINILPFLKYLEGEVAITPDQTQMYMQAGDLFFFFRAPLTYPPQVESLIRSFEDPKIRYEFNSEKLAELRKVLSRTAIMDSRVILIPKQDKIIFLAIHEEGEMVETIKIEAVQYEQIEPVAFNNPFLQSAIKGLDSASVGFFGSKQPVKITSGNYAALVQAVIHNLASVVKKYDEGESV